MVAGAQLVGRCKLLIQAGLAIAQGIGLSLDLATCGVEIVVGPVDCFVLTAQLPPLLPGICRLSDLVLQFHHLLVVDFLHILASLSYRLRCLILILDSCIALAWLRHSTRFKLGEG